MNDAPRDLGFECFYIAADRSKALLRLTGTGASKPIIRRATAGMLDNLTAFWGQLRASLLPEVPRQWASKAVEAERDPVWQLEETDPLAGDPLLHLRDPRFGWLHYIITKSEARRLGARLIEIADIGPPAMKGSA